MGKIREFFGALGERKKISSVQLMTERGNGFYAWNGKMYESDIVRACIRPYVKAVGKLVGKHIRDQTLKDGKKSLAVNPEPYIRFLLEEPNPYMTGQMLQEKLAAQLILNNNAFALIQRDELGYPSAIYPVDATNAEAIYGQDGALFLRFYLENGKTFVFAYTDIIHLRGDFLRNDIFGDPLAPALEPLMQIVTTTDQGIIKAIKNSAVIRWLLKFSTSMRPEDIEDNVKRFSDSFMSVQNGTGVAGIDSKAEAVQVTPNDYVPNAAQMDKTTARIYAVLNTNPKIVTSSATETEQSAYFDSVIEPVMKQMEDEWTRKLFSRKERGFGNRIVFEANAWDFASTATKLNLMQMVDRGAMTPNEWRRTFNLAPVEGGDQPIRRLDTRPTDE